MKAKHLYKHLSFKLPLPVITDTGRTWTAPIGSYTTYKPDFYSAQLLHYGLKPLKTKGPAKKRLLEAFGGTDGKSLDVPKAILELEEAMRDWHRSNSAMKHEEQAETETPLQSRGVLAHPLPSSSTKPPQANRAPKTKQTAVKSSMPSTSTPPQANTGLRTKQTAVKRSMSQQLSIPDPPRMPRTKQTVPMGLGRLASIIARKRVKKFRKTSSTPTMTSSDMRTIKSLKADEVRRILTSLVDNGLPASQKLLAKELSSSMDGTSTSSTKAVDLSEMTGLYDIEAPGIENEDYGLNFTFEVYSSSTSSHLWASFDFGAVSGVMRSIHPAPSSLDTEVYFEWRGRDSADDIMTFMPENRAVITFLPGGLLEGKMAAGSYGTFKIYGSIQVRRHSGRALLVVTRKSEDEQRQEVRSWKDEWRGLNAYNFDVECTERWGKWGGEEEDDTAFESDTTAGKKKRPWKIDVQNFMEDPDTDSDSESSREYDSDTRDLDF